MKVDILASGSAGNCIAVQTAETTILVDVGIAKTKVEKRLLEVGIRPDSIDAIFITHAHSDHVKGLPLANKYKIPVYAAEGEWKSIKGVKDEISYFIEDRETMYFSNCLITAFKTHHDAFEPLGYTIVSEGGKASICLDTGHTDPNMLEAMRASNIYIIEANHDITMLEYSQYPDKVKARILSDIGHLSNGQTAEALHQLVQGKGEKIYLTHLSGHNNYPELAKMTVMRKLAGKGFKAGKHYEIEVV